jgi:4-hydroxyacetophenone monooxygenase
MEQGGSELLEATDALINDAVRYADPLVLRGVLYQLTGDEDLLGMELKTLNLSGLRDMHLIADPEDVARIRKKAGAFLASYRDAGAARLPVGPAERLQHSMSLTVGVDVASSELEMWLEELGLDPWARSFSWSDRTPPVGVESFRLSSSAPGWAV